MRRARYGRFLPVPAAAVVAVLAGCASNPGPTTSPTSPATSAPRATSAPSSSTAPPPGTAPPGTAPPVTPPPSPAACRLSSLQISLSDPLGSAGALHYEFRFTNTSLSTCTLYGFPGVSFLDAAGGQIGPAAQEGTAAPRQLVTLPPGATGYATLDVTDPGIPPCAGPGRVADVRVFPPGSYTAALLAPPGVMQVCSSPNTATYVATTVGPVTATPAAGYNP